MTPYEHELIQYSPNPEAQEIAYLFPLRSLSRNEIEYLEECKANYYAKTYYNTTWAWRNV